MAISPEWPRQESLDFRAPPPSPVASGRRSSVSNAEVLSQFIESSVRVPDLVLPDKVFPKQRFIQTPPTIDFLQLDSEDSNVVSRIQEAMASIGCFQVVNHGVHEAVLKPALAAAHRVIFDMPPEKRLSITRSPENHFGFEEDTDEFMWSDAQSFRSQMEGLRPTGYYNFSELMEELTADAERIGEKIVNAMRGKADIIGKESSNNGEVGYRVWCLRKHNRKNSDQEEEVMRMLIRGFDHSHALCLHFCEGSSEFHVYSKKGWICFCLRSDALLVTVGDQIQAWSGGKYKQVVGRAIYKTNKEGVNEHRTSLAFLYSHVKNSTSRRNHYKSEKTISFRQQLLFALFLTLVFRFCFCSYTL